MQDSCHYLPRQCKPCCPAVQPPPAPAPPPPPTEPPPTPPPPPPTPVPAPAPPTEPPPTPPTEPPPTPPTDPTPPINSSRCDPIDWSRQTNYCNLPPEDRPIIMLEQDGDLCNGCLRDDVYGPARLKCIHLNPPNRKILPKSVTCKPMSWQQIDARDKILTRAVPQPPGYYWAARAPYFDCTDKVAAQDWWWNQPESATTYLRFITTNDIITQQNIGDVKEKYNLNVAADGGRNQLDWVRHVYNPNPPTDWNPPPDWKIWLAAYELSKKP